MTRHLFPAFGPVPPLSVSVEAEAERATRRTLERWMLGRARRLLRDVAAHACTPSRVVRLGLDTVELAAAFPGAMVRGATLGAATTWRGWPDLVWADHLLSTPGAEVPVGTTLDRLADALPPGAHLAFVDLHPTTPSAIQRALGLRSAGDHLGALRARLSTIHEAVVRDRDGVHAVVFVGQR